MNDQHPLPRTTAAAAEARCAATFFALLARRRVHQPRDHLDMHLDFADKTSARVYRETVVDREVADPCTLVVAFRLRFVRNWGHPLFRIESQLNTPLFVGFPGYSSKLWLAHDQHDVYRGVYAWDGADQAEAYARALWRVLELVCEPGTIAWHVLPGLQRDAWLADPGLVTPASPGEETAWWRLVGAR